RLAGQVGVALYHLLRRRPVDQVVIDRAAVGAECQHAGIAVAEVEPAAPGVVEEDPVAAAVAAGGEEERDALVQRIGGLGEAADVGVPVHERAAAPDPWTGFASRSDERRV